MSKKINRRINGTFKRSLIYGVGVGVCKAQLMVECDNPRINKWSC